jgi:hypothetical protein
MALRGIYYHNRNIMPFRQSELCLDERIGDIRWCVYDKSCVSGL